MNEVVCHIASYDAVGLFVVTWKVFFLNVLLFAGPMAIYAVAARIAKRNAAKERPYHV